MKTEDLIPMFQHVFDKCDGCLKQNVIFKDLDNPTDIRYLVRIEVNSDSETVIVLSSNYNEYQIISTNLRPTE